MRLNTKIQDKEVSYFVEPTYQGKYGQGLKVCTIIIDGKQYHGATGFKSAKENYIVERVFRDFNRRMGIAMDIFNGHKAIDSSLQYEG